MFAQLEEKPIKRSKSLGTQDWMDQTKLGSGQNITYYGNTGIGNMCLTATSAVPSNTYTLSSALSMK